MILLASRAMPFSNRGRALKVFLAFALFYAGRLYNVEAARKADLPMWSPRIPEGRSFWLIANRITGVDPEGGWIDADWKGWRVHILVPEGRLPAAARAAISASDRMDTAA